MNITTEYLNRTSNLNDWQNEPVSMGTTLMACEFDGGVVLGADSRTTSGSLVVNRLADKISPITDRIFCLRSGSAADTQCVREVASYHLSVYEMETDEPLTVGIAANAVTNLCYNNRDQLLAGIIVAGYDDRLGGQVYNVSLGGMLLRQPIALSGSGSTYIYGYADSNYKEKMSKDECIKLVTNAIALAISRDGSSGGVVRLVIVTKDGAERRYVSGKELPKFYEG